VEIKYSCVSAVSRRSKVGWFDTRAVFDDDVDYVVWTPFVLTFLYGFPLPLVTRSLRTWRGL